MRLSIPDFKWALNSVLVQTGGPVGYRFSIAVLSATLSTLHLWGEGVDRSVRGPAERLAWARAAGSPGWQCYFWCGGGRGRGLSGDEQKAASGRC